VGETTRRKRAALSPGHCEFPGCDWRHPIQRHRIQAGRDGGKYRKGNVISLCPNHHWLADHELAPCEPEVLLLLVGARPTAE
jgi:hypothetical protein